jgi:putative endonuclease
VVREAAKPDLEADAEQVWFCYMLECADGALYIGIAIDVDERVKRHNWGVGPEFTARRRQVELIWSELCGSVVRARRREKEIKGWSRERKLGLLNKRKVDRRLALKAPKALEGSTKN